MTKEILLNAGSIHDVPIGGAVRYSYQNHHFAIFRETYGHFCVFEDNRRDAQRGLHQGKIKDGKIQLGNGHCVDLHTGELNRSGRFLHTVISWVENGFILLSISGLIIV